MKWRRLFAILVALLVAACAVLAILIWQFTNSGESSDAEQSVADRVAQSYSESPAPVQVLEQTPVEEETSPEAESADAEQPEEAAQPEETETAESETPEIDEADAEATPYVSPVDFETLQAGNPEIYAWLYIPNSDINYPILQSETDDSFYLDHDSDGNYDYLGSIFTEKTYTGKEFTDPVTVVYGHKMRSTAMFGQLQEMYTSENCLDTYSAIQVYLPERELQFEVFAAVPYDNRHILYNYDFTDERTFRLFFEDILSVRSLSATFAEDISLKTEDQVLILSTCLAGDSTKRFLVCAKLVSATDSFGTVLYN